MPTVKDVRQRRLVARCRNRYRRLRLVFRLFFHSFGTFFLASDPRSVLYKAGAHIVPTLQMQELNATIVPERPCDDASHSGQRERSRHGPVDPEVVASNPIDGGLGPVKEGHGEECLEKRQSVL